MRVGSSPTDGTKENNVKLKKKGFEMITQSILIDSGKIVDSGLDWLEPIYESYFQNLFEQLVGLNFSIKGNTIYFGNAKLEYLSANGNITTIKQSEYIKLIWSF